MRAAKPNEVFTKKGDEAILAKVAKTLQELPLARLRTIIEGLEEPFDAGVTGVLESPHVVMLLWLLTDIEPIRKWISFHAGDLQFCFVCRGLAMGLFTCLHIYIYVS